MLLDEKRAEMRLGESAAIFVVVGLVLRIVFDSWASREASWSSVGERGGDDRPSFSSDATIASEFKKRF